MLSRRTVVIDIETNGLTPDKIWCIVCKDVDSKEVFSFVRKKNLNDFLSFSEEVGCWIGHNILSFDSVWANYLFGQTVIDQSKCIDTLIVSRLIHYLKPGGHSVLNWGKDFGMTKVFIEGWNDESEIESYLVRCQYDVEIQTKIYESLKRFIFDPSWRKALRVEHDMQIICNEMSENGFSFDARQAEAFLSVFKDELERIKTGIQNDVKPTLVRDGPVTLKINKDGVVSKRTLDLVGECNVSDGARFERFHYEAFNPRSVVQRVKLLEEAGWQPVEKTKSHLECERQIKRTPTKELQEKLERFKRFGWKVNETNLNTLPETAPESAKDLAKWLTLDSRAGDLEEWLAAYSKTSGKVHGKFSGIGSWTHRMSHSKPNQANIYSDFQPEHCVGSEPTPVEQVKLSYNGKLRALWQASKGKVLVGTDAEAIQLRVLAHYINDEAFTKAIAEGRKEDKTDIHSFNQKMLGPVCHSRDVAKTFIFAWLLGAGIDKIAKILNCSVALAQRAMKDFMERLPGLKRLKEEVIPEDARRGYFIGLDGRKVICKNQHLVLTGYLQNGESVVMKHANVLWRKWADKLGYMSYRQINFVHDEWICEVPNYLLGEKLGCMQVVAIKEVGEELNLNCPLSGSYKIGKNWLEVH